MKLPMIVSSDQYLIKPQPDQSREGLPDTPEWFAWLASIASFHFAGTSGSFTARKTKKQRGGDYWYAYRKAQQKTYSVYIGRSEALTIEHLEQVAATLAAKLPARPGQEQIGNAPSISPNAGLESVAKIQQEISKPLLEVDRTHPFEMRVLVYRTRPSGQEVDTTGIWLEQVRGANKDAIFNVAKFWYRHYEEPCVIIKHEEDGSERQLYAWPIPPKNQSYENYCKQLRVEEIERQVAAEVERQRIEDEEEDDLDEDEEAEQESALDEDEG